MADMIKFYKGALANLPASGTNGALYITTDEGAIYLGTGVGMKRLGDFVQVDAVANLPASANTSALYYCVAENVLAKWSGTEWKQVNKQPTKDELKVMLGLDTEGDVTKAIAAAKKAGDDAQVDVDTLSTYVGTFTHGTAKSVVEYIDAKTSGIATSDNLELLTERVTQAEKDIDAIEAGYLKAADKTELEGKIEDAQTAADNAQTYAEGVAGNLKTHTDNGDIHITAAEREAWNGKTDLKTVKALGYATKEEAKGYADAKDEAIQAAKDRADEAYTLADGKADMDDVNTAIANAGHAVKADVDTALENLGKAYVAADEALETKLQGNIDKKVAQDDYNTKMDELDSEDERLAGLIKAISDDYLKAEDKTALQGSIDGVAGRVATIEGDYLKGEDKEALEGQIALKADQTALSQEISDRETAISGLQTQINTIMSNPDAEGAINSINEFTQYVTEHGEIADGFRTDINKNKDDIAAEVKRAGEAEAALAGRLDVLEDIDHDAYKAADTALKNELDGEIAKKADATALADAVKTLEEADTGLGNRITALETASAGYALKTEVEAVSDALTEYKEDHNGDYNNEAIDAKVQGVQDQINALGDTYATDKELTDAIAGEVERANGAYAAKTLESTVDTHVADKVVHITADERTAWNAAEQNAKDHADGLDSAMDTRVKVLEAIDHEAYKAADAELAAAIEAAKTDASNKDTVVLAEAQKAVAAAKTELQGNIDTVSGALETYKTSNDAEVAKKANSADVYTKTEVEAMLTWGEF